MILKGNYRTWGAMADRGTRLPPLNALRAAETAARTGSIAAAAAELGVTPAAVSQQLRLLEDHLGRRLFDRGRQGVVPTAAGRAILPHLTEGFAQFAHIADLAPEGRAPGRIAVSASASAASTWLPDALASLHADDPTLRVEIRVEEDPVRFDDDGPDLRIGYGDLPYSGLARMPLVQDALIPLCGPDFGLEWSEDAFIHTDWGPAYASPPTWRDWAARARIEAPNPRLGHRAGAPAVSVDMAAAGMGIALANALYARKALVLDRLAVPFGPPLTLSAPYMLYYRDRRPDLASMADALRTAAERHVSQALARVPEARLTVADSGSYGLESRAGRRFYRIT